MYLLSGYSKTNINIFLHYIYTNKPEYSLIGVMYIDMCLNLGGVFALSSLRRMRNFHVNINNLVNYFQKNI